MMEPSPEAIRASVPEGLDVCVSFVLFGNDRAEIERAVVQAQASSLAVHVMVIDNSCPPLNLEYLSDREGVTVVTTNANLGYGRGHNIALRASVSRCRYNLVLNTDLQMAPDVLPALVTFMDERSEVGLTMPRVVYPDGSLQRLCRLLPVPTDLIGRRFFARTKWAAARNRIYEFHDWDYNSVAEFPFLSGCFMLIRSSILDTIGYFDERYFLYAEDLDLSRRINAAAKTLYVPHATVVHEYRSQSRPSFRRLRYAAVSLIRYFNKWGWVRDTARDAANTRTARQFIGGDTL